MANRDTHKTQANDEHRCLEWCWDCGASGETYEENDLDRFSCAEYQALHPSGKGLQCVAQIQPEDYQ